MRGHPALVIAAALAAVACDPADDGPHTPYQPPAPTTGTIVLHNGASRQLDEVYAAQSTATDWGARRNFEPVAMGGAFTMAGLPPGTWKLLVTRLAPESVYLARSEEFPLAAGEAVDLLAQGAHFSGSLKVTNAAVAALTALYVSPSWAADAGPNQLPGPLAGGTTYHLIGMPADSYVVRCEHQDVVSIGTYPISSFTVTAVTCGLGVQMKLASAGVQIAGVETRGEYVGARDAAAAVR